MKLDFQIIDWKFRILGHTLGQLPAQVKTGIKREIIVAHNCTHHRFAIMTNDTRHFRTYFQWLCFEASFLINICSAGGSSASCTYSGRGPYGWPPSYFSSQRRHTFFFSFEKGLPMRHLQFILVPYLQCHKLLANSRKWFPAETCSPMLYRLFIIRTT